MNPSISSDTSGTFRLEGTLDIYSAERLQKTWPTVGEQRHVTLDSARGDLRHRRNPASALRPSFRQRTKES
jgi:hypothetical protein